MGRHTGRRWLGFGLGILGTAGLVIGAPGRCSRDSGAALELVAADADGKFRSAVTIPASASGPAPVASGAVARVPLVLAVRNRGGEAAAPGILELSVPIRFRVTGSDGRQLPGVVVPGNPLVRYEIRASFPLVEPAAAPVPVPLLDTVWLEPTVVKYHCIALSDSVPSFEPARVVSVDALSELSIFYSFSGGDLEDRQTGLLTARLDPALLAHEEVSQPPVYPAQIRRPSIPLPAMSGLAYVGHRRSWCGPPEQPLELFTTTWETLDGGRMYVLDHGGVARKYLFDLSGDGVIELEMWDSDGDGRFEARRAARLPVPELLLPPARAPQPDYAHVAELPADSLAKLDRFAGAGSYASREAKSAPSEARLRPLTISKPKRSDADDRPAHTTVWGAAHPLAGTMAEPAGGDAGGAGAASDGRGAVRPPGTSAASPGRPARQESAGGRTGAGPSDGARSAPRPAEPAARPAAPAAERRRADDVREADRPPPPPESELLGRPVEP